MKYFYTLLVIVFFPLIAIAQNNWDVVWTMDEKPFLDPKTDSEIAIVKAGFDTDEDGWGEFLCAWTDKEFNYLLMYEASADNTYDLVWYWEYPVPSNTFAGIAVGDFDNNGLTEIVTTVPTVVNNDSPKRLWVFEWNGVQGENKYGKGDELGSITATNSWNFGLPVGIDFRPYGLTIEDIDNDGKNELIVGVRMGDRGREIVIVRATGNLSAFGTFETEFSFQESFGGSLYNVTTGDLDNDGNKEIYGLIWDQMTIRFFETTGANQYELVTSLDQVTAGVDYGALDGVRVADANNDGVNEMYIAGTEPDNTIFMVTNISDVSQITATDFVPFYQIPQKEEGKFRSMQVADPDGDGNLDLMIAGEKNGQIFDLEYKGSGDPADSSNWELNTIFDIFEYAPDTVGTLTPRFFYGSPAGDMDNDGKQEY
ncbi:MAG: VCBS repeat-containing protein, partial [Ignavibacteriae bacterium]|nr:VCBS repeat-containing protein [Ignavibacteriota bacterium]